MTSEDPPTGVRTTHLARRILPYLKPYRGLAVVAIVLTVLSAALNLLHPWPLAFVVDNVVTHRTPPGWVRALAGTGINGRIIFAVVASVVIMAVGGLIGIVNEYVTSSIDRRMALDLRSEMLAHSHRLPMTFHDSASTGDVMFRINDRAEAIGKIVVAVPDLALGALTLLGMLFVAFHIDAQLALVSAAVVPFVLWSTRRYTHAIDPELRRVQGMEGTNLTLVHEGLTMLRVIVAFGRERQEHERFRAQGEQTVNARVRVTVRQAAFNFAVGSVTAAGTAAVVAFGAHDVLTHRISAGELLVVIAYIAAAYAPLHSLTNSVTVLKQQFVALQNAFDLLDVAVAVVDEPNCVVVDRVRGDISLRDVDFSYVPGHRTLGGVSFDVRSGEVLAIVGATGAGKTTLVNLLPRFYEPDHGTITIDGHNIRTLSVASLRAQFSLVLQEPLLFSQTIRENIAYSCPGASIAEIEQAARDANAHDFIQRLPNKYETRLGERGTKISVGERQRIAVARAFLRNAPIVILDEPTSSIDSRTEAVILDALDRLMEGRTTIVIAHRLSTIRRADRVLVMHDGRVAQNGSHDELFAQEGPYREMWAAQALQRVRLGAARAAISEINDATGPTAADLTQVRVGGPA
jgi:ATP-binding cassette subfamily B protein